MTIKMLKEKYASHGISNFQLRNIDDLELIHGVSCYDIKGFYNLHEVAKNIFEGFLVNFYNRQGIEHRATIMPISVRVAKEQGRQYIRFDYSERGIPTWLHVRGTTTWD